MYKTIFTTHLISVIAFLLIYLIKTILLLANKKDALASFTKTTKIPEMIVSTLFLATGIYMLTQIPEIKTMLIIKIIVVLASIPVAIIGFKKSNKPLAVLSLVMIIGAYGLAEMSKKQNTSLSDTPEQPVTAGNELYFANCTQCHGSDGKLGLVGASDLSVSTLDIAAKVEVIKNGRGSMAAFAGILNDEQLNTIAEYTETLKK